MSWGAFMNDMETGENWNNREKEICIYDSEMFAVKFSLKSVASDYKKMSVQINIGKTTIVSILKKIGHIS